MDLDSLLNSIQSAKPRMHHYLFAHRALPRIAFADPEVALRLLRSSEAPQFIDYVWRQVCQRCTETTDLSAASFKVHPLEASGLPGAIIVLPPPQQDAEAHFAALILRRVALHGADTPGSPALLYYTLEKGRDEEGSEQTYLCGWNAEGTHLNFGDGPAAELNAFAEAVTAQAHSTGSDALPAASFTPRSGSGPGAN